MDNAVLRELAVDRSELEERVYLALRRKIIDRELVPGTVLTIRQVAGALNVSPTPARDALRHLIADGLPVSRFTLPWRFLSRTACPLVTLPDALGDCVRQALYRADPSNPGVFKALLKGIGLSGLRYNRLGELKSEAVRLVALGWAPFPGSVATSSATVRGGCQHD